MGEVKLQRREMETWDLYDENRKKTNRTMERGSTCPDGMCRLIIHVCVFNKNGEMLIQQRQSTKKLWPNAWDVTLGGSVIKGENSKQAAERELFEELGIKHEFSNERAYMTINFDNGFDDFYLIEKDVDLKNVKFIDDEVQNVKWASEKEIIQKINNKEFIGYYPSFIRALFEMRTKRGVRKL